ncbi:redoxin domain-containing protein [Virgibacillus sp. W0181]|uniref:redoxin domain-containing protein n=1 Tax=Virgibacillus sp. W0181 TaxID=3391581 RepID=UPI003F48E5F5
MKKGIIIAVIVGLFAWAIYDFVLSDSKGEEEENVDVGLEQGNLAPDFELTTLDGETVKLSDFRGERVMLNFWATWCPPCRAEMPDMQKFHENTDVEILAVNLLETESGVDKVPEFIEEFGVTFRILLDEDSSVANRYEIQPIPTTFMIDSEGKIQNTTLGALNYELMVQEYEKMD